MGVLDFIRRKPLFKAVVPELKEYIGKYVRVKDDEGKPHKVKIRTIVGNMGLTLGTDKPRPHFYEINGTYLINMLRFHAQMNGDKSITEEEFIAFENTEFYVEPAKRGDTNEKKSTQSEKEIQ